LLAGIFEKSITAESLHQEIGMDATLLSSKHVAISLVFGC
jgi:hypothetical protein